MNDSVIILAKCGLLLDWWVYHSKDSVRNEASSELSMLEFVHFWEIEVVIKKLFADLLPKSRFSGPEYLSDISPISPIVTDKVRV